MFIDSTKNGEQKQVSIVGPILKNKTYEVAHILGHFILADTVGPGG